MQFTLQPDRKQGTLKLSGEVTLLQANELLSLLTQALEDTQHVVIETEGVTDIDMSALQLLCAAHKSALKQNKQWIMEANQPDVLAARVAQAGLVRQSNCDGLKDTNCLWMKGKS